MILRLLARFLAVASVFFSSITGFAGGPLVIGGPNFGKPGQPFTWDPAKMPIQYRVDPGPMSVNPSNATVIDNATGLQRVQDMFAVWQSVPTAAIAYSNAGPLLPAGSYTGGDLNSVQQFNDVVGSCKGGVQNPVIFDANGQITSGLGLPPEIIGFTSGCALDAVSGHLTGALIVMNGQFQDGVNTPSSSSPNFELTANEFDEAITHEIGHFSGLGHSQINIDLLTSPSLPCDVDKLAGLPLMFPEEICQARKDGGLPILSPDDVSLISSLYPNANTPSGYGTISGTVYFSDGRFPGSRHKRNRPGSGRSHDASGRIATDRSFRDLRLPVHRKSRTDRYRQHAGPQREQYGRQQSGIARSIPYRLLPDCCAAGHLHRRGRRCLSSLCFRFGNRPAVSSRGFTGWHTEVLEQERIGFRLSSAARHNHHQSGR